MKIAEILIEDICNVQADSNQVAVIVKIMWL